MYSFHQSPWLEHIKKSGQPFALYSLNPDYHKSFYSIPTFSYNFLLFIFIFGLTFSCFLTFITFNKVSFLLQTRSSVFLDPQVKMKKYVKKDAYLPSSHVPQDKSVIFCHLGMLEFMGEISISLAMEFIQCWILKNKIFGQKSTYLRKSFIFFE